MKYSTTKTFYISEFKDQARIERLLGLRPGEYCPDNTEIECEIECRANKFRSATYIDPSEGGDVDDVCLKVTDLHVVVTKEFDLVDELKDDSLTELQAELYADALDHDAAEYEDAMRSRQMAAQGLD